MATVRTNRTKRSLLQGRAVLGPFLFLSDPTAAELAGLAGFDFVVIDMEHTPRTLVEVQNLVMAAETADITPIVRVPEMDEKLILRVLETGAQGIMVPLLETHEEAARAASAVHFPPAGKRGTFSHSRPARYGLAAKSLARYFADADREVLLIGLIETAKGVENIESILDAGIDVALVGRGDLSSSMGLPGEPGHSAVMQAADRVLKAIAKKGGPCWGGMAGAYGPREIEQWGGQGCRFFLWRDDTAVLMDEWRLAVDQRKAALEALATSSSTPAPLEAAQARVDPPQR